MQDYKVFSSWHQYYFVHNLIQIVEWLSTDAQALARTHTHTHIIYTVTQRQLNPCHSLCDHSLTKQMHEHLHTVVWAQLEQNALTRSPCVLHMTRLMTLQSVRLVAGWQCATFAMWQPSLRLVQMCSPSLWEVSAASEWKRGGTNSVRTAGGGRSSEAHLAISTGGVGLYLLSLGIWGSLRGCC